MLRTLFFLALCSLAPCGPLCSAVPSWVHETPQEGDFALAGADSAAPIVYSSRDYKVVALAATDLQRDIEAVTGVRPTLGLDLNQAAERVVVVGTLGHSPVIDAWVAAGKLNVSQLQGAWETFLVATVTHPQPNLPQALVVVGSDRRGTAFGIYELSQAIGVSPWHWWSDVAPARKTGLFLSSETRLFGPPSVRYRGIFINDEDWGLQPWAAHTFEPERGNIGPKTYQRVFELLLRLKANTLWPAMHACSTPFNAVPENAQLADDYAIVMGSSHAEPMLRNNVGEWKEPSEQYNYVTHRDGVRAYWEERVKTNGRFENLYTLGMRGIHDSGMQGAKTDSERIQVLEQVFDDQRSLLSTHVNSNLQTVPQLFCAYKEVLALYRQGLKVPIDVTIVWPDDNFGYIRNFATPEEQRERTGGFGVYYHLSYLGAPLSYLWLSTTPPALIWEELAKAYDHGARQVWIANVGDIKPAEIATEFFLSLAWDMTSWQQSSEIPRFLQRWATREFGTEAGPQIAEAMKQYYVLNYQRKPEHLQWWLPREAPRRSDFTEIESKDRLEKFTRLTVEIDKIESKLKPEQHDAFFELVAYPVHGSALANQRFFATELYELCRARDDRAGADQWSERAHFAHEQLGSLTRRFNQEIAGGKWRGLMSLEPADKQWSSMRISAPRLPPPSGEGAENQRSHPLPPAEKEISTDQAQGLIVASIEAEHFDQSLARTSRWQVIPGLGRNGDSVAVFPTTPPPITAEAVSATAPRLEYAVTFAAAGDYTVTTFLIPTHPLRAGEDLQFYLGCDEAAPHLVAAPAKDGSRDWALGVLNATTRAIGSIHVPTPGRHTLCIYGSNTGVVLDKIVVHRGPLSSSYFGPEAR